jgi:hypothetical protein
MLPPRIGGVEVPMADTRDRTRRNRAGFARRRPWVVTAHAWIGSRASGGGEMLSDQENRRLVEIEAQLRISDPTFVSRMSRTAAARPKWWRWVRSRRW